MLWLLYLVVSVVTVVWVWLRDRPVHNLEAKQERDVQALYRQLKAPGGNLPRAVVEKLNTIAIAVYASEGFVLVTEGPVADSPDAANNEWSVVLDNGAEQDITWKISSIGEGSEEWVCKHYPCRHKSDGTITPAQCKSLWGMLRRFGGQDDSWILAMTQIAETDILAFRFMGGAVESHVFQDIRKWHGSIRGQDALKDDLEAIRMFLSARPQILAIREQCDEDVNFFGDGE